VRVTPSAAVYRLLLVVALLAGWQAALQHPIVHVDELGEFVHLESAHSQEGDSESGPLCHALAALTACAVDAHVSIAAHSSDYKVPPHSAGAPRLAQAPPFLSQGPPARV
jgi:hypothetical protein